MPKVKIVLEHGEDQIDADHALQKALELHSSGEIHDQQLFDDPAMVHVAQRMSDVYSIIYSDMVREINTILDEEYQYGGE